MKTRITEKTRRENWASGMVKLANGRTFRYNLLAFDEPSDFGIDGGRISKLWVATAARLTMVVNYDRGWDVKPATNDHKAVYAALLKRYN